MIQAINTAYSGMLASSQQLNVHANNIANINTPGYKASRSIQSETFGGGTHISSISKDFSQGPIEHTGFDTDYALTGTGFFTLKDNENISYTRNGAFQLDANGDLVNSNGRIVDTEEIINFNNPNGLKDLRNGEFDNQAMAGEPTLSTSEVLQGSLEGSNVNLTTEMVGKLKAQLSYNANASIMKTANQMTETLLDIFT